jgi:hypothetical protein
MRKPLMATPRNIESARLKMLEIRKVLEDHESLKGLAPSSEHTRLSQAFARAADVYLRISACEDE